MRPLQAGGVRPVPQERADQACVERVVTLTLVQYEIGEAIVEYLAKRGVTVTSDQLSITYNREADKFLVYVNNVELPPKEGPYR